MNSFLLVTDLDHTLVGEPDALLELNQFLMIQRETQGAKVVYATGRSRYLYEALAEEAQLLTPDILVTAVGAEIYVNQQLDQNWAAYLANKWVRSTIIHITSQFPTLKPQPDSEQLTYKISFFLKPEQAPETLAELELQLTTAGIDAQLIYSSDRDLDILPKRADKGKALTYVREKLGFSPERTIACGDSGNDIALFTESTLGIIVGNARSELVQWHQANPNAQRYLAQNHCAAGILEGLTHFGFRPAAA
jgi:sucrose-6-phosphatase